MKAIVYNGLLLYILHMRKDRDLYLMLNLQGFPSRPPSIRVRDTPEVAKWFFCLQISHRVFSKSIYPFAVLYISCGNSHIWNSYVVLLIFYRLLCAQRKYFLSRYFVFVVCCRAFIVICIEHAVCNFITVLVKHLE